MLKAMMSSTLPESVEYWLFPGLTRVQTGKYSLAQYDPAVVSLIEKTLGKVELPAFCSLKEFDIRGKIVDHNDKPLSKINFTLAVFERSGSMSHHIGGLGFDGRVGTTNADGEFLLRLAMDSRLLETAQQDSSLYFVLGVYRDANEYPSCSIAGYVRRNKVVKNLWSAQSLELDGQDLWGIHVKVPRSFDWSPVISCP